MNPFDNSFWEARYGEADHSGRAAVVRLLAHKPA